MLEGAWSWCRIDLLLHQSVDPLLLLMHQSVDPLFLEETEWQIKCQTNLAVYLEMKSPSFLPVPHHLPFPPFFSFFDCTSITCISSFVEEAAGDDVVQKSHAHLKFETTCTSLHHPSLLFLHQSEKEERINLPFKVDALWSGDTAGKYFDGDVDARCCDGDGELRQRGGRLRKRRTRLRISPTRATRC
ncbi:uncharacterized protein G2W53_015629 [Senna tora]|uniref:Uncharacterized protein n=1 Tax=Senna tora TaxID=362788 RepID=A0A835C8F2_9FABA|nr:uncharacterized protein G2W53_015629 [Senna tora]